VIDITLGCAEREEHVGGTHPNKKIPTLSGGVSGVRTHIAPPMSFVEPLLV
jgi:hypothetical protein